MIVENSVTLEKPTAVFIFNDIVDGIPEVFNFAPILKVPNYTHKIVGNLQLMYLSSHMFHSQEVDHSFVSNLAGRSFNCK